MNTPRTPRSDSFFSSAFRIWRFSFETICNCINCMPHCFGNTFFFVFFLHFSGEKAHTHTQARKPTLNTHSNDAAYQRQPHNNNNVSLCSRLNLQTPVAGHYFICSVQLANILFLHLFNWQQNRDDAPPTTEPQLNSMTLAKLCENTK